MTRETKLHIIIIVANLFTIANAAYMIHLTKVEQAIIEHHAVPQVGAK